MQIEWDINFYRYSCGIYCFIHRASGKVYVGQTVRVGKRIRQHIWQSENNPITNFHKYLNKYGVEEFDFEMIEECSPEQLGEKELFWIKFYGSDTVNGFNSVSIPGPTPLGTTRSEVTCQRISAAKLGEVRSPQAREKVRLFRLSYIIPESTKLKMSESAKNRPPISEITRAKLRKSSSGFRHSEATKQKLRELKTGLVKSPETIEKLRKAGTGRKHSPETLARMRASALARGPSELRNKKLQEAADRRFGKKPLDGQLPS